MSLDLFQLIFLVAVPVGVVGAVVAFAGSGRLYDSIGRGYLDVPDRTDVVVAGSSDSWNGEAALDTRQLLDARSALRRRHGKRTLDADAEIRAILRELER